MALRIVLTNDDGIEAPGLAALHGALEGMGERIVVAPSLERSGASHTVTTDDPLSIRAVRPGWTAVGGTPVDCARVALRGLVERADWLLSGINRGANVGADVFISGTVGAAREAAFLDVPAIAVSQYTRVGIPLDWDWTRRQCARVLRELLDRRPARRAFWSVNLPHLPPGAPDPEVVFCPLDLSPHDVRFSMEPAHARWVGDYHGRPREQGSDVDVCFGGRIAVTEVRLLP